MPSNETNYIQYPSQTYAEDSSNTNAPYNYGAQPTHQAANKGPRYAINGENRDMGAQETPLLKNPVGANQMS